MKLSKFEKDILETISYCPTIPNSRYHNSNGMVIPSVTELLSFIDNESLIGWANWMGRQGRDTKEILNTAASYGTNTHNAIDKYLDGDDSCQMKPTASYKSFLSWYQKLKEEHRVEILGHEEPMKNEYFAGTYDLLLKIDDRIVLIDFKTSNHVGYKYFIQLAAYRYLLYTTKNINIHGCLILHLGKNGMIPKAKEYYLDFTTPEHYNLIEYSFKSFLGILYAYYNVHHCKQLFDSIFKGKK